MKNIAFIINPISGSKETQNAKRKKRSSLADGASEHSGTSKDKKKS